MAKKTKAVRPDIAEMEQSDESKRSLPVIPATGNPIVLTDEPEIANNDLSPEEAAAMQGRAVADFCDVMRSRVRNATSQADIFKAIIDGNWSRNVLMLTPFNRPINPHAHFAITAHIRKQPWLGYSYESNTVIQRARNFLADKFLKSEAEWSWWVDQDTVASFGSPGFFYETLGVDQKKVAGTFLETSVIQRLLSHGKTIIGGVYAQRKPRGKLVIQPDLHPRDANDQVIADALRSQGPRDKIIPVRYIATGCALVHRKVYEDIQALHPELAPRDKADTWDFFGHDVNHSGEDIHFCELAKEAGHQAFLDCGVFCCHLGEYGYMP